MAPGARCASIGPMADHDAWLVDLDGTLYHATPVKFAMTWELVTGGVHVVQVLRRFRQQHEVLRHEAPSGTNAYRIQLERTAALTGMDVGAVERAVVEWMHVRPGKWISRFKRESLLDEIRAFRSSGGRTALVSDYPAKQKLASLGVTELFDVVIANGETEGPTWLKPDPSGYLEAAKSLGITASRCLVIGDRDDADGQAARAAKMGFRRV
jgi:HAD superfamily hydrolase (TIGR01549 family)